MTNDLRHLLDVADVFVQAAKSFNQAAESLRLFVDEPETPEPPPPTPEEWEWTIHHTVTAGEPAKRLEIPSPVVSMDIEITALVPQGDPPVAGGEVAWMAPLATGSPEMPIDLASMLYHESPWAFRFQKRGRGGRLVLGPGLQDLGGEDGGKQKHNLPGVFMPGRAYLAFLRFDLAAGKAWFTHGGEITELDYPEGSLRVVRGRMVIQAGGEGAWEGMEITVRGRRVS